MASCRGSATPGPSAAQTVRHPDGTVPGQRRTRVDSYTASVIPGRRRTGPSQTRTVSDPDPDRLTPGPSQARPGSYSGPWARNPCPEFLRPQVSLTSDRHPSPGVRAPDARSYID